MRPIFNSGPNSPGTIAIPSHITRAHVSKHSASPGTGKVRIGADTGLRKLMRAARRGLVPQERVFLIEHAMRSVAARLANARAAS